MATLIIRNVDDTIKLRLAHRAAENGRSMEAEVRALLNSALTETSWLSDWLEMVNGLKGEYLDLPTRTAPRSFDLADMDA